jgi:hypothetical protein
MGFEIQKIDKRMKRIVSIRFKKIISEESEGCDC